MSDQPQRRPSLKMLHRLGMNRQEQYEHRLFNPDQVTFAVRVDGVLDLDRLAHAWELLQARHPVLGSSFELAREHWRTEEAARAAVTVSHLPADSRDIRTATDELTAVLLRPFDLTRGPLARLHVVTVEDSLSLVGLAAEHLVCDGWSAQVLFAELWQLYQAPGDQLPPVPVTFAELVAEEYAWLASPEGLDSIESRIKRLGELGPLPPVRLPGTRVGTDSHQGAHLAHFAVSPADLARLRAVDGMRRLTSSTLAHAALAAALHLLSGDDRVGTVMAVANRADRRVHRTQGWLSDSAVVLTRAASDVRKPRFLQEFGAAVAEALDYSALPLTAVLARMEPDLIGRLTPYPTAGFNSGVSASRLGRRFPLPVPPGLMVTEVTLPGGWHYKAIVVYATDSDAGVSVRISVKDTWFERSTADLLAAQMHEILFAWAASG